MLKPDTATGGRPTSLRLRDVDAQRLHRALWHDRPELLTTADVPQLRARRFRGWSDGRFLQAWDAYDRFRDQAWEARNDDR